MNNQTALITSQVAAELQDRMEDFVMQELISAALKDKITSFRRMVQSINRADIDVCKAIKAEVQMIAFVPQAAEELHLQTMGGLIKPTIQDGFLADVDAETDQVQQLANAYFLNREWFLDASDIRSEYLTAYDTFPVGNTSPGQRYKIVDQNQWEHYRKKGGYSNHIYGTLTMVVYEPSTKRFRFAKSFSSGTYVTWNSYLIPAKVDLGEVQLDQFDDYSIKAPPYAEYWLVLKAIERMIPIGNPALEFVQAQAGKEEAEVHRHIPAKRSIIEVSDGYIG